MEVGALWVRLGLKVDEFNKGLAQAESKLAETEKRFESFQKVGDRLIGIGQSMLIGVTLPIVAAGAAIIKFGADATESENLFAVSMGKMADAAREWSRQLSDALGLNEYELRRNVGLFNTMFISMGFGTQAAYQMSTGLTQLAYDMASFYNLRPEEAFEKLRAGIMGETEPLKAIGIALTETTVQAYAYKHGIAKVGEELTEQQKIAARFGFILEATSQAQGDMARTGDEVANQARRAGAGIKELSVDLYKHLEPSIKRVLGLTNGWIDRFKNLSPKTQRVLLITAGLAATLGPLTLAIGVLIKSVQTWAIAIKGVTLAMNVLRVAILTNPIGLLITAIVAVGAAIAALVVAWKRDWGGIREKTRAVVGVIVSYWNSMVLHIATAFNALKTKVWEIIARILDAVAPLAKILPGTLENAFEKARAAVHRKTEDVKLNLKEWQAATAEASEKAGAAIGNLKKAFSSWETPKVKASGKEVADAADKAAMSYQALDNALVPVGDRLDKTSEKVRKAAEDTREAWERTTDILSTKLQILQARQDIAGIAAERHGDKTKALTDKITWLNKELDVQKQIVATVNEAYLDSGRLKGWNSEETLKLALRLDQEKKAQAELEKEIYDTNQAIKDQAKELRELSDEVTGVEKKYREDLAAALEDYERKVSETNRKLADDERWLTEEYERSVDQRAKSLRDFVGLFDAVQKKDVSGAQLLENLRGQVEAFEDWQENIAALAARGVDEGLIAELREMGPKAGPEIAALLTLTDDQLSEYASLWRTKNAEARDEAVRQLEQQRLEMQQKLAEIRAAAAEQLEAYRVEWEKKNAEIRKNAEEEMKRIEEKMKQVSEAGTQYGVSLMTNFIGGIESKFKQLRSTLEQMAGIVDSYMPHSPAKRGPLSRLAEWGPALVQGLAEGIRVKLPVLSDISARMATLSPTALAPAIANSYSTNQVTYGGSTIVVNINGTNAREIWRELEPIFRREFHKTGGR